MVDPRITDLQDIQKVFDSFNVEVILVYGALLGFYRDKDFLPGDDDIDLAVIDPIGYETRKAIGRNLLALGFTPLPIAFNVLGEMEVSEPGYNGDASTGIIVCQRNFKFTIFFFQKEHCEKHGEEYVCVPKMGAMKLISTPAHYFLKLGNIKIGKKKYLTPSPVEAYLADTYFNNWKDKTDRRHGLLYTQQHEN